MNDSKLAAKPLLDNSPDPDDPNRGSLVHLNLPALGAGSSMFAYGVAIDDSTQVLFVCDNGNHRVLAFNLSDGEIIWQYGTLGKSGNGYVFLLMHFLVELLEWCVDRLNMLDSFDFSLIRVFSIQICLHTVKVNSRIPRDAASIPNVRYSTWPTSSTIAL